MNTTSPIIRRDVHGLGLDALVAEAESALDTMFEQQLLEAELDLDDAGADRDWVAEMVDRQRTAHADWKAEKLAELKQWLAHYRGKTLQ